MVQWVTRKHERNSPTDGKHPNCHHRLKHSNGVSPARNNPRMFSTTTLTSRSLLCGRMKTHETMPQSAGVYPACLRQTNNSEQYPIDNTPANVQNQSMGWFTRSGGGEVRFSGFQLGRLSRMCCSASARRFGAVDHSFGRTNTSHVTTTLEERAEVKKISLMFLGGHGATFAFDWNFGHLPARV